MYDSFEAKYQATVGIDFLSKTMDVPAAQRRYPQLCTYIRDVFAEVHAYPGRFC